MTPPHYTINPTAFVGALILAPLVVTLLTFWTVIGFFALFLGAIPYLVIGTPILLWAVGRIEPGFADYAGLGIAGNMLGWFACFIVLAPAQGLAEARSFTGLLFGFGMIFAPLYAGTFGALYRSFHPNIRLLEA